MTPPGARSAGELLEATFNTYRVHFLLFAGILAPAELFLMLLRLGVRLSMPDREYLPDLPSDLIEALRLVANALAGSLVVLIAGTASYAAAGGASSLAVWGVVVEGRNIGVLEAYRGIGSRIGGLLGLGLLLVGLFGLGFLLSAGIAFLAASLLGMFLPLVGALVGALILVPGVLGTAFLLLRYAAAPPALVLEGIGIGAALGRSAYLTRGSRGRVLLVLALMSLIGFIASFLLQGPFLAAGLLASGEGQVAPWIEAASVLAGGIAGILSGPFFMIAQALLYLDLRARKEGQRE